MNDSDVAETLPLPSEGGSPEVREQEVQEASSTSESLQEQYLSTQSPNHFPQAMPVDFTDVNFNTIQRDTEAIGRLDDLRDKMTNSRLDAQEMCGLIADPVAAYMTLMAVTETPGFNLQTTMQTILNFMENAANLQERDEQTQSRPHGHGCSGYSSSFGYGRYVTCNPA